LKSSKQNILVLLDEIEHALMKIRKNPEHFPQIKQNIRKYVIQKFPFNIFFEVFDEEILILAIGHQKRKPQYWKDRI
jgi:hypothetical protein